MNDYQLFHPLTSDLMTDYSLSSDHFISCVSITTSITVIAVRHLITTAFPL